MIESKIFNDCVPYYEFNIEKLQVNIWYASDIDYYCIFEGFKYKPEYFSYDYDYAVCYFSDLNSEPILKTNDINGFMLLCFLAQKENCKKC